MYFNGTVFVLSSVLYLVRWMHSGFGLNNGFHLIIDELNCV